MRRQTWKYLAIAAFATVALTISAGIGYARWSPLYISDDEGRRRVAAGATVLDVRSDPEFALSHYPGSVHIPVDRLDSQAIGVLPSKSQPIVIYCKIGRRARIAAEHLQRLGYSNVAYITGSL
jgi:rhodanese-related sulfurtransferase